MCSQWRLLIRDTPCWRRGLPSRVRSRTRKPCAEWACAPAVVATQHSGSGPRDGESPLTISTPTRPARFPHGRRTPLEEVMVENSTFNRGQSEERLYDEGLKERRCELCGQGEVWRGRRMALILDHINGDGRDNRLENLRIVCPNCAATLDTHCGRNVHMLDPGRMCGMWAEFRPRARSSNGFAASIAASTTSGRTCACLDRRRRKVPRPTYEQLKRGPLAHELARGGAEVRRQRQRRAEVDAVVQRDATRTPPEGPGVGTLIPPWRPRLRSSSWPLARALGCGPMFPRFSTGLPGGRSSSG